MPRQAKFDRVVIGKAFINVIEQPASLKAEAAFVDTSTGATHGMTNCSSWSPATVQKLRELLDLMSADLEATHFTDGSAVTATTDGSGINVPAQGLGEHLRSADDGIPQG